MKKQQATTTPETTTPAPFDPLKAFEAVTASGKGAGGNGKFFGIIAEETARQLEEMKEGKRTQLRPLTAVEVANRYNERGTGSVSNVDVRRSFQPLRRGKVSPKEGTFTAEVQHEGKPYLFRIVHQSVSDGGVGYLMMPKP